MIVTMLMVGLWIVYAIFYQDLERAVSSLEHAEEAQNALVKKLQQELAKARADCGLATSTRAMRGDTTNMVTVSQDQLLAMTEEMRQLRQSVEETNRQLQQLLASRAS